MMRHTREVAASDYVRSRKLEPPMYLRNKFRANPPQTKDSVHEILEC